MAYGKVDIRIKQVSTLRGDQKTKDGDATDGGYARKSFFVETHLEGETIDPKAMRKAVLDVCKPALLKHFAGSKYRPRKN